MFLYRSTFNRRELRFRHILGFPPCVFCYSRILTAGEWLKLIFLGWLLSFWVLEWCVSNRRNILFDTDWSNYFKFFTNINGTLICQSEFHGSIVVLHFRSPIVDCASWSVLSHKILHSDDWLGKEILHSDLVVLRFGPSHHLINKTVDIVVHLECNAVWRSFDVLY